MLLATQTARKYALENNKPVLIEAMSYRLGPHSTSDDPSGYRSKEEEELWAQVDGVLRYKNWLELQGWWDEEQETALYEKYRTEIKRRLKWDDNKINRLNYAHLEYIVNNIRK